jgi:protein-L-isoaspartate(D-aspartate) O-methyltransferase
MNIENARIQMIEQQVRACSVFDPDVLRVLTEIRRENFVPPSYRTLAFADTEIPIGHGQYMMSPQVEGRVLQALQVGPADRILEVGTGTGFLTGCLAMLGGDTTSLEFFAELTELARRNLHAAGQKDCRLLTRDVFDWQPETKFNRIVLTGSLPVYDARFEQWLEPGGRLFAIVGVAPVMEAMLIAPEPSGSIRRESLFETQALPLINAHSPRAFRF